MSNKLSSNTLIKIAEEMYLEGTYYSERYSTEQWNTRGWPQVDDVIIYKILDSYIRFLRTTDGYNNVKREERSGALLGRLPKRDWD